MVKHKNKCITILHMSDTQFGQNHAFGTKGLTEADRQVDKLKTRTSEDLKFLKEQYGLIPDLYIVTGDITEWGRESEFKQAKDFFDHLLSILGLSRKRLSIIPGNHDINRAACQAYFSTCEADEKKPERPFWPKFRHYSQFFQEFYHDIPGYDFLEKQPWSLFEIPDLRLVIVGLNSCLAESHRPEDHYGHTGEAQLEFFANMLKKYKTDGWYRIAIVHHNIFKDSVSDDEFLRDESDLRRILVPHINILLHGHTHNGKLRLLAKNLPVLSTGSSGVHTEARPNEVPNQYQIIQISPEEIKIYCRAFDSQNSRWIGDNRISDDGSNWIKKESIRAEAAHETFGLTASSATRKTSTSNALGTPRPKNTAASDNLIMYSYSSRNQSELYSRVVDQAVYARQLTQQMLVPDTPGACFQDSFRQKISASRNIVADITFSNINTAYLIGYALSKKKRVILIKNKNLITSNEVDEIQSKAGIFESIYTYSFHDADELVEKIRSLNSLDLTAASFENELNLRAPVYVVEKSIRTDDVSRLISAVKKTIHYFRSFDPTEQIRLSPDESIAQVSSSIGIIVQLASTNEPLSEITNLRAAFVAGIAHGLNRELLILHPNDGPISRDNRFEIHQYDSTTRLDSFVRSFADTVARIKHTKGRAPTTTSVYSDLLSSITLGASCAENEFQELGEYYIRTNEFERALKGEVRLVVGRKGSGKTALFAQVRDKIRSDRRRVVIDLKPDGYQIKKFNEQVLSFLEEGTKEHTVTAFWGYLLLMESCYKILEKDAKSHLIEPKTTERYRRLSELYRRDEFQEADFSERTNRLIDGIAERFKNRRISQGEQTHLSRSEITEFLYSHDVSALKKSVATYLGQKEGLWILFDNLDKGWSTHGITRSEALSIRCLLDAARKLEQDLQREGVECHTLVFIRNDVYDWLIEETPDRGKEAVAELDWKEADELRELLRRRLVYSGLPDRQDFMELWRSFCTPTVDGVESSQYLIERSLMRPRFLLDLVVLCRSTAMNRQHKTIEPDDIRRACARYSKDIVYNINYEIEDVFPKASKFLYLLHGHTPHLSHEQILALLARYELSNKEVERLIEILLWQGVLGVSTDSEDSVAYIYSVQYDINRLGVLIDNALRTDQRALYYINPAFWPHLAIG